MSRRTNAQTMLQVFLSRWMGFLSSFLLLTASASAQGPLAAHAGTNITMCLNDTVKVGGAPAASGGTAPYTYSWQPIASLSDPIIPNPFAFPVSATAYTLTVTDSAGNSAVSVINVNVYLPPAVSAGPDITIVEGTNTLLHANGAVNYYWVPPQNIYNQNSADPLVQPASTTEYCVIGVNTYGCPGYDCMKVYLTPNDELVTYNAFTPDFDGTNDFFYVGNIHKYPDSKLEVFNRNGKLVYHASPYLNNWDGKSEGVELPAATYYYILTPGGDKAKVHGSVTIIR